MTSFSQELERQLYAGASIEELAPSPEQAERASQVVRSRCPSEAVETVLEMLGLTATAA